MPPGNLDGDVVVEPAFLSQDSVVVADAEPRRRRRKRKQREPNLVGRGPCVVVVVIGFDCKEAIPPRRRKVIDEARRRAGLPVEDWSRQGVGATLVLGLVVVPSWELKATDNDAAFVEEERYFHSMLDARTRRQCSGYISYPVLACAACQPYVDYDAHGDTPFFNRRSLFDATMVTVCAAGEAYGGPTNIRDLLQRWAEEHDVGSQPLLQHRVSFSVGEAIVRGSWNCLHIVPVIQRMRRPRFLHPDRPPKAQLRLFRQHLVSNPMPRTVAEKTRSSHAGAIAEPYKPAEIVRFLNASKHLRDQKNMQQAATDILFAMFPRDADRMLAEFRAIGGRFPAKDLLARARVRLDMVAMLIQRSNNFAEMRSGKKIHRYLFVDASPQGGVETFGCYEEVIVDTDPSTLRSRYMPLSVLGHGHQSVADKVAATLWMAWLETGCKTLFLWWCTTVRSITSDFGTESAIADFAAVGLRFLEFIQHGTTDASPLTDPAAMLFPRALQLAGWHHIVDGVIKYMLQKFSWWAPWLLALKSYCRLLRTNTWKDVLVCELQKLGRDVEARAIHHFAVNFAEWRWGTIYFATKAVADTRHGLAACWKRSWFSSMKDTGLLESVDQAVKSPLFFRGMLACSSSLHRCRNSGFGRVVATAIPKSEESTP